MKLVIKAKTLEIYIYIVFFEGSSFTSLICYTNFLKQKILFGFIRPIFLRFVKTFLKLIGQSAFDVKFYHRKIMVVAKNEIHFNNM